MLVILGYASQFTLTLLLAAAHATPLLRGGGKENMIQLITPKDQPTSESGDTITASPWERCETFFYYLGLPVECPASERVSVVFER